MYQDYLNCPWPLSIRSQGKLHSSFTIYNVPDGHQVPYIPYLLLLGGSSFLREPSRPDF
jgi:hypothetical protein